MCVSFYSNAFQTDIKSITRVVIEGEPGSGKTTFMKAVCKAWMSQIRQDDKKDVQHEEAKVDQNSKPETDYIGKYLVLLAFLLRHISTDDTLYNLISKQFYFLTCSEVFEIEKCIANHPREICLFFDGVDECKTEFWDMTKNNELIEVITGKDKENVLCISTTRSQGISQLQGNNANAVQAHVKLCGFSQTQIRKYISAYFRQENSQMENYIKEHNLWKLASVPIRLQMMCFVWKIYQKLGNSIAELYSMLLKGLLDHMEKRSGLPQTQEKDIMDKYHETVLMPTARLADRWDKNGNLIILFSFADIKEIDKNDREKVLDLGCVTKYYPSSQMAQTLWNFTHLSLQEYLVAFNMVYSSQSFEDFSNRVFNIHDLVKYQPIVEFLCNLAPKKSNEFITAMVKQDHSEVECIQILNYILDIMPAYKSLSDVDIPLPRIVVLGLKGEKKKMGYPQSLSHLFVSDQDKHRNMSILKVHDLDELPPKTQIDYVVGLCVTITQRKQLDKAKALISRLSDNVNILDLVIMDSKVTKSEMEQLLCPIKTEELSILSVKSPWAFFLTSAIIEKQSHLEVLSVNETNSLGTPQMKVLFEKVSNKKSLKELRLYGALPESIPTSFSKELKITIQSKCDKLAQLSTFCDKIIPQNPNIFELDLSFSTFHSESYTSFPGKLISKILIHLSSLMILRLRKCGLTSNAFEHIGNAIKSSKKQVSLQELDLLGNKISTYSELQVLLDCLPRLNVLLTTSAKKSKLPENLGQTKVIVATGTRSTDTIVCLSENMYDLDKLYLIHALPDFSEINDLNVAYQITLLFILDVAEKEDTAMSLSKNMQSLPKLKEFHFTCTNPKQIQCLDNILLLIHNLPASLRHLNLYGYESLELTLILKEKHSMQNLQKLNIGSVETAADTIQIIRHELQQINDQVKVYCDKEESLTSLLSYSIIKPPSDINLKPVQDAEDLLHVLSEIKTNEEQDTL